VSPQPPLPGAGGPLASGAAAPCMAGRRYRVALAGGGPGLAAEDGRLELRSPAPCQWRVYQKEASSPWFRLSPCEEGAPALCLDLTNPGQEPQLAAEADVSGQYWQLETQVGCKELEGGAVARCVVGYRLHAMWTGPERMLSGQDGVVGLRPDGAEGAGQIWEILDEEGQLWTLPAAPEPEIAVCDFGGPQGGGEEAVLTLEPRPEPLVVELREPPMLCGGKAPPAEGGPAELLAAVRGQAEDMARAQGWNGVSFKRYEPVSTRTQVVAGVNHYCKVQVDEEVWAHITIYAPLPGQGEPKVTGFRMPVGLDEPL